MKLNRDSFLVMFSDTIANIDRDGHFEMSFFLSVLDGYYTSFCIEFDKSI